MTTEATFDDIGLEFHRRLTNWRQLLHGIPETGFEEKLTSNYVAKRA